MFSKKNESALVVLGTSFSLQGNARVPAAHCDPAGVICYPLQFILQYKNQKTTTSWNLEFILPHRVETIKISSILEWKRLKLATTESEM